MLSQWVLVAKILDDACSKVVVEKVVFRLRKNHGER